MYSVSSAEYVFGIARLCVYVFLIKWAFWDNYLKEKLEDFFIDMKETSITMRKNLEDIESKNIDQGNRAGELFNNRH